MSRPGRPERPIDSTGGPLPRLAGELRRLRGDRTYRELADETELSAAALRAAAAGEQLPTWRVTRAFIAACGGDEGTVRGLWEEACAATGRPVPASPLSAEPPPVPDPEAVTGDAQFVEELKNLRVWAGSPSLADLNRRSGGFRLPPSTVSEMLRKPKLPRLDLVLAYVRACGLNDEQAAAWEQAWAVLKAREMHEQLSGAGEPGQVSQAVLDSQAVLERRRRAAWAAFRDFLVWMSGARPDIVARTPADRAVYTAVGGTILLTSVITALSAAFALHVALTPSAPAATAAGVVWGVGITSLDRVLVASIHRGQRLKNFLIAIPRVLLALLLGLVIAAPITLRIFAPEINAQIVATLASTDQAASRSVETLDSAQITADRQELDSYLTRATADRHELSCALYGGSGCPNRAAGPGPVANTTEAAVNYDQTVINNLQSQLYELLHQQMAEEDRAVAAANQNQQGLLSRLDALDQLADHDAFIAAAQLLLFILFVLIGCTPLIVRAVKVYGSHDADEKGLRAQELADMQLASQHQLARELIAARTRVEQARLLAWQEDQLLEIAKGKNHRPGGDDYDAESPAALPPPSTTGR